ncbi:hypothetical protein SAMN02745866_01545 [Alteromonadaceae bacterium Bs31]|nr:hypothetical protein SAMN02745866_01545 [Alteromonadaceae bacterium Bs31]
MNVNNLVLVFVFALTSLQVSAERSAMEIERDLFQAGRKAVVADAMSLNNQQADVFWPLYNSYREDMRAIGDRRYQLLKQYADGYLNDTLTDKVAAKLLDQAIKLDQDKIKVSKKHIRIFRKAFPDMLVARFFQIEGKLDAMVDAELARDVPLVPQAAPEAPTGIQLK